MIELPWPPKELSPNARVHWAIKARAAKKYRLECWAIFSCHRAWLRGRRSFSLTFHPPSRLRIDLDNCVARVKYLIDAMADLTGIDDSEFALTICKGEPRKGGAVFVA